MCRAFVIWETLLMEMVERILLTPRIRNGWMKFRELLPFLTSRAPVGDESSSVCQLCENQHDLW